MSETCICGKQYPDHQGVALCMQNRHGTGKHEFSDRYQSSRSVETEIKAVCDICDVSLSFKISTSDGEIKLLMLPHICASGEE